jgi:ketosteroid isomerase-like protein
MKIIRHFALLASAIVLVAGLALGPDAASAQELPANIAASTDAAARSEQQIVYGVVHKYEQLLNSGDTNAIANLFADEGVAEWNDKPTFATRQEKIDGYRSLFKIAKFSTVFAYDTVDVYGNIAIVRTHHHVGAAVIENGKEVLDYNREVFVLRKQEGSWKIILYTFNTNPIQGVG